MPSHLFGCRLWILATLPTGQLHMLIGQRESGIQSHMQQKMSQRQHWQQFRQFGPHLTSNATIKYHPFWMFWIYVFSIHPQAWDLQVCHMTVRAWIFSQLCVVAASLAYARTNCFMPSCYRLEVCFNLLNEVWWYRVWWYKLWNFCRQLTIMYMSTVMEK
jgi:hypothetical protein